MKPARLQLRLPRSCLISLQQRRIAPLLLTSESEHFFASSRSLRSFAYRTVARRQRPHRTLQLAVRPPSRRRDGACASKTPISSAARRATKPNCSTISSGWAWIGTKVRTSADHYAPYRQSDRLAIYREHAERLVSEGKAYLCFCSQEELERDREEKLKNQQPPIYSGKCRVLDPAEARAAPRQRRSGGDSAAHSRASHSLPRHRARHGRVLQRSGQRSHHPALQRHSGLQLRGRGRRRADEHYPRHSRRRSPLQHAQAGRAVRSAGLAGAAVRASLDDPGQRSRAAVEAPRRNLDRQLSRDGRAARGADELSGVAGLGARAAARARSLRRTS